MTSNTDKIRKRPLSPHLQIYKFQLHMVMSIVHRITGAALALGMAYLTYWLVALAQGPEAYFQAQQFFGSGLGRFGVILIVASLYYHLCNGVRHLVWDVGRGFALETINTSGYWVIGATAALTLLTLGKGGVL
jgi:succinate dehydrogenase / fumarate reductase cytochrome b subunit